MTRKPLIVALLFPLLLRSYQPALAGDYPNTKYFGIEPDRNAPWYKQCLSVSDSKPNAADLPSEQLAASLLSCEPIESYYATLDNPQSTTTDWRNVLYCAHRQSDTSVLAMLYANGYGTQRNLKIALRYVCESDAAPAEMEGRVEHISTLMTSSPASNEAKHFDFCDDITSGMMQGFCAGIDEERRDRLRISQLHTITAHWSAPQKTAFAQLKQAFYKFSDSRGTNETDASGTARAAMALETEATERDLFLADIKRFEQGKLPRFTAQQFRSFDRQLNTTYKKLMQTQYEDGGAGFGGTTITKESVRDTQRDWLAYRDAFVAFGAARYPAVAAEAWMAMLTERRIAQVAEIIE